MKIAIISDIHDNLENLKKCLDWCFASQAEAIFCCGDVAHNETLRFLSHNYDKPIHLVRGNCCLYSDQEADSYPNIEYYGHTARFSLAGRNIGLCHEPSRRQEVLEKGACDIIFYGHTHRPWEQDYAVYKFINPGPVGGTTPPFTFAVWETDNEDLVLMAIDKL